MYTPVGGTAPRESSFRLIAATNQDLTRMVREKTMRSDFYYRVHVLSTPCRRCASVWPICRC